MIKVLSLAEVAANVELSRGHIAKQNAIITRLTEQGRDAMAAEARGLLVTMQEHLAIEINMLARMQNEADALGKRS